PPASGTLASRAYGKIVWSRRPRYCASSLREDCNAPRGEHDISRQTIAQGRPCVGLHLYAAVRSLLRVPFAQQTAGAAGTRPSLRPPALDGREWSKARASSAARLFTHVRAKTPAVVPANAGTHTPQPTFGEDRP
ncbi:hypothetical protein KXW36_009818, partial [Aspergillus fumigatus]